MPLRLISNQLRVPSRGRVVKHAFAKWAKEINAEVKRNGLLHESRRSCPTISEKS